MDIYLCRADGSRELIFENVSSVFSGNWFLDKDGNYIILQSNAVTKVDKTGNAFFSKEIAGSYFADICQLPDGQIYLLEGMDEGACRLLAMDSATGEISVVNNVALSAEYNQSISAGEDYVNFITKAGVEIGTGGGPDLIFYDAVASSESLAGKGAFADLRPYMEASGMKEEDFFSAAFGFMQMDNAIYAAGMVARPTGLWISEELLGSRQLSDIETLLNALLNYDKQAIFQTAWESDQVLEYFLEGSETLWGMVDWEKGTCDFGGELFAKMLEAAKRYGFDRTKELPYVAYPMKMGFYSYETQAQMESEGKVPVGFIFEDGGYQIIN